MHVKILVALICIILISVKEILASQLNTIHNLHFLQKLMTSCVVPIEQGKIGQLC